MKEEKNEGYLEITDGNLDDILLLGNGLNVAKFGQIQIDEFLRSRIDDRNAQPFQFNSKFIILNVLLKKDIKIRY